MTACAAKFCSSAISLRDRNRAEQHSVLAQRHPGHRTGAAKLDQCAQARVIALISRVDSGVE
jgi:hypothetical protein